MAKQHKENGMDSITKSKAKSFWHGSWVNKAIAGAVVLIVLIAGYTIIKSRASGFFAAVDAGSGTLSGNASLISDTSSSTGKAVQFNAPVTPPPPPPTGSTGAPKPTLAQVPWETGPNYYNNSKYSNAQNYKTYWTDPKGNKVAWTSPYFFPIGVWSESVLENADAQKDIDAGLNTYVGLTDNSDPTVIRNNGMSAFEGDLPNTGLETVGEWLTDEPDMWAGPGTAAWTGNYPGQGTICSPSTSSCGYTVMSTILGRVPANSGRMNYANYGKGVAMWESDTEAAKFVSSYTDVVSDDMYFYTDPNLCGGESVQFLGIPTSECKLSANYGAIVARVRSLDAMDGKLQPVYAFIEDGHPFTESTAPTINGNQIKGAVWSSLINEARGIIYFNHNFGGSCISQHVLRDSCGTAIRPSVQAVNQQIRRLASVLNTQSYKYTFNSSLDTMFKWAPDPSTGVNSDFIFAMQKRPNTSGTYTFTLPSDVQGTTVKVVDENRTIPISGGKFTDSFAAEYSYHIYEIAP